MSEIATGISIGTAFYSFVLSPDKGDRRPSLLRLSERITQGTWPLNPATRHQTKIAMGDLALIYVSGSADEMSGCFIATVQLAGPREIVGAERSSGSWVGLARKTYALPLASGQIFGHPVPVKNVLHQLSFISDVSSWGSHFFGGIVRISRDDYEMIVGRSAS